MKQICKHLTRTALYMATLFLLLAPFPVLGETPLMWGDLEPGEYSVGFKTIEVYDHSRTFHQKRDSHGQPYDGSRARPIQICLWYPAQAEPGAEPVVYSEYAFPTPEDFSFFELVSRFQMREIYGRLFPLFRNNYDAVMDALKLNLMAVRDAAPATGPYPLLVYHPDLDANYCENVVLFEYLASHGLTVMTTRNMGRYLNYVEADQIDIETLLRDREFALDYLRENTELDFDRIGVIGHAGGSVPAVLMSLRYTDIDAVAILQGWNKNGLLDTLLHDNIYFDRQALRKPMLIIRGQLGDTLFAPDLESPAPADRRLVAFDSLERHDLTHYGQMLAMIPDTSTAAAEAPAEAAYETICRLLSVFFKAHLAAGPTDPAPFRALIAELSEKNRSMTTTFKAGIDAPPLEADFVNIILDEGPGRGREIYDKYKGDSLLPPFFRASSISSIAYIFMTDNRMHDAIAVLQIGIEAHPDSLQPRIDISQCYMYVGDVPNAIGALETVRDMMAIDTTLTEARRRRLTAYIDGSLGRLQSQAQPEETEPDTTADDDEENQP